MSRGDNPNLQRQQGGGEMTVLQQSYSGPLPPPAALEKYDQVLPGSAERILSMAESQHRHRQNLELNVVNSNISAQRLGVILGFVIAMTTILGGIYLVATGKPASGLAAIITPLAALVGVFVYGKREQHQQLDEKRQ
jgi:uncharacterized membrane protein